MTATTRSKIRYLVVCEGYLLFEAHDRDEAEELRDSHANRNRRPIADYRIEVELREEAT